MKYIKQFQEQHNLLADGIIGKKTLAKMKEVFNITNDIYLAHFLGQLDHETAGFKYGVENLNYSKEGLLKVFKKYFNETNVDNYARQPEKIANLVYANRMGNGDEKSGEGFKFRGRGAIQLTGRDNYEAFAKELLDAEILINPDVVATKYYFESALFFFDKNNLWSICKNIEEETIKSLTRRINGGFNGLDHRIELTKKYYNLITK